MYNHALYKAHNRNDDGADDGDDMDDDGDGEDGGDGDDDGDDDDDDSHDGYTAEGIHYQHANHNDDRANQGPGTRDRWTRDGDNDVFM